jgi:hypothetical protein
MYSKMMVLIFLHVMIGNSFGYPLPSREQPHAPKPNGRKPFYEVIFWER